MKNYILGALLILSSRKTTKMGKLMNQVFNANQRTWENCFTVEKTDSAGNFYVIYAKLGKGRYKLLSRSSNEGCRNIITSGQYNFRLRSARDSFSCHDSKGPRTNLSAIANIPDATYYGINLEGTIFRFAHDRDDFYFIHDAKGLCYTDQ